MIQFILKPKKEYLLWGGGAEETSVGQLLEQHLILSCRISFSGGSWREKLNKPTHRMESPKQTAEERYI